MTISPESRAQALADAMLDRGLVPIVSTECRALIAQAICQACNEKLEEAALGVGVQPFDSNAEIPAIMRSAAIVRAFKDPTP